MYYRYKSRKKDRRFLKLIIVICLSSAAIYILYSNKNRLMIWKINQNKITSSIDESAVISDKAQRSVELRKLADELEAYKKENTLDPEAYIMAARLYMRLGLNLDDRSFSEMYIDDSLAGLSRESRSWLMMVIRDTNKAIALYDGKDIEVDDLLSLARAAFLTGYYQNDYIYGLVSPKISQDENVSVENARFYSLLCISSGRVDEGLDYLQKKGAVEESVQGRLFKARALNDAMKYTEAIIAFQAILKTTDDSYVQRTCYLNLGRIYYNQRLYRESLDQYTAAVNISADNNCKIWMGRNYLALGDRENAKKILAEAAAADPSNEEVNILLGSIK